MAPPKHIVSAAAIVLNDHTETGQGLGFIFTFIQVSVP